MELYLHLRASAILFTVLTILSCGAGCSNQDLPREPETKALALAIEANMEYTSFHTKQSCTLRSGLIGASIIETKVVAVPLNREVVSATVDFKAASENLSAKRTEALREKAVSHLLNGTNEIFIIITINDMSSPQKSRVWFENFGNDVIMRGETKEYAIERKTATFNGLLSQGWNKGYVYYPSLDGSGDRSYTLHFEGLVLDPCINNEGRLNVDPWTFTFERSEIRYLALLEKGVSSTEIRSRHGIPSDSANDFSFSDIMNIIGFILQIITMLK